MFTSFRQYIFVYIHFLNNYLPKVKQEPKQHDKNTILALKILSGYGLQQHIYWKRVFLHTKNNQVEG